MRASGGVHLPPCCLHLLFLLNSIFGPLLAAREQIIEEVESDEDLQAVDHQPLVARDAPGIEDFRVSPKHLQMTGVFPVVESRVAGQQDESSHPPHAEMTMPQQAEDHQASQHQGRADGEQGVPVLEGVHVEHAAVGSHVFQCSLGVFGRVVWLEVENADFRAEVFVDGLLDSIELLLALEEDPEPQHRHHESRNLREHESLHGGGS